MQIKTHTHTHTHTNYRFNNIIPMVGIHIISNKSYSFRLTSWRTNFCMMCVYVFTIN